MHMTDATIQRSAMHTYITALQMELAPDDPPLKFAPCHIPEVHNQILDEAIDIHKHERNPVLNEEDTEVPRSPRMVISSRLSG